MSDDKTEAEQAAVDEFPDYSWHQVPQTVLALMRDAFVRGWAAHDAALLAARPAIADRETLIALLDASDDDRHLGTPWAGRVLHPTQAAAIADALLASGVLNGRSPV